MALFCYGDRLIQHFFFFFFCGIAQQFGLDENGASSTRKGHRAPAGGIRLPSAFKATLQFLCHTENLIPVHKDILPSGSVWVMNFPFLSFLCEQAFGGSQGISQERLGIRRASFQSSRLDIGTENYPQKDDDVPIKRLLSKPWQYWQTCADSAEEPDILVAVLSQALMILILKEFLEELISWT